MVYVKNLTPSAISANLMSQAVKVVLLGEKKAQASLSVVFVSDENIGNLNQHYRGQNKPTDVLSFAERDVNHFFPHPEGESFLGEIIICPKVVKEQAKLFGTKFRSELIKAALHGTLHLLGYDHEQSGQAAKAMERKEARYLEVIFKK